MNIKQGQDAIVRWDISDATGVYLEYGGRKRGQIGTGSKTIREVTEDTPVKLIAEKGDEARVLEMTIRVVE